MGKSKKNIKKIGKKRGTELSAIRSFCSSLLPVNEPLASERIHLSNGVFLYSEGDLIIN